MPRQRHLSTRLGCRLRAVFSRFRREKEGAAAIEFALLVVPFLIVIFASIETFVAFAGEQLLTNATETLARQIRTGQISPKDAGEFRKLFCAEISIMMPCSDSEASTPSKLFVDVRGYTDMSKIPTGVPQTEADFKGFGYAPQGDGAINLVRAYYRWSVVTDLVRPFVAGLRPAGGVSNDYLMAAATAFRNEK